MSDDALNRLADRFGIVDCYRDLGGTERRVTPDTQRALLRASGLAVDTPAQIRETLAEHLALDQGRRCPAEVIVTAGTGETLTFGQGAGWQVLADGTLLAEGRGGDAIDLPPLPVGVYDLVLQFAGHSESVTVLAAPARLPQVHDVTGQARLWGLNVALYGLRSGRNCGLGDYEDLARLGEIAARGGAGFLGINPVHAMGYADETAISPYSPSHRGFLNTRHIALDQVPGTQAEPGRGAPRDSKYLDYAPHRAMHNAALESRYAAFCAGANAADRAAFAAWRAAAGADLAAFAAFEATSELHGPDWRNWPGDVQRRERAASKAPADRACFHAWLQWVASCQIGTAHARARAAGMPLGLYLDLAVGPRRGGAETWCETGAIAQGVSIGAPPDHLSPEGQNWDLAAFAPRPLQQRRFAPFRRILASVMRHAGVLRIDHVLGLNRSFWVPDDGSPGGYVRQPFAALVALIRIEAARTGTVVVGEDLGLVPEGFRATMRKDGFYGYSVLQYERDRSGRFRDPADYDAQVLACFGTHDTPTLRGFAEGCDIRWWQRLGWIDADETARLHDRRRADAAALCDSGASTPQTLGRAVHTALAQSPAALVSVQLDDVLGQAEAQNLPGTIDEHPNWRRSYETPLEALETHPDMQAVAGWMRQGGRAAPPPDSKEV